MQVKFHALTGNLPSRHSPWSDPSLANDPYARAYRDQLERAVATPKVPEWERIATELRLIGEQLANNRITVDDAAAELDRRADAILEKRRWMLDQKAEDRPRNAVLLPPGEGGAKRRMRERTFGHGKVSMRVNRARPHPPFGHLLPMGEGRSVATESAQ